jgi:hypothetical protein
MPIRKESDEMYDEPDDQQERLNADDSDEAASAVGLLPKTILMGQDASVGDELILKITAIHDDQIEVAYPTESSESESEEEPVPAETAEAPVAEAVPAGAEMYE